MFPVVMRRPLFGNPRSTDNKGMSANTFTAPSTPMADNLPPVKWLIWSIEHNAWWAPARCGYVQQRAEAGRYSWAEAAQICFDANRFKKSDIPNEAMCPDE